MYHFRLQRTDGSPADPPTFRSSTLNWRQGDRIYLTGERTLRVLGVRDDDADQPNRQPSRGKLRALRCGGTGMPAAEAGPARRTCCGCDDLYAAGLNSRSAHSGQKMKAADVGEQDPPGLARSRAAARTPRR